LQSIGASDVRSFLPQTPNVEAYSSLSL